MSTKTKMTAIGIVVVTILVALIAKNKTTMNAARTTDTIVAAVSVSTVTATMQTVTDTVTGVGTVNANNDVAVVSESQGRVVKVCAEVGDYKEAGSVLVEIDSELKEAAYKAASVTYEKAKKDLERYESLYGDHLVSESQIEQARWAFQAAEAQYIVARRQLRDTKITTPISGYVTARFVNLGTMVMGAPQATQVANVVDISKLKAKVNVSERDVLKLHVGDPAEISTDLYPRTIFPGRIHSIPAKGDDGHTYAVEVLLNNPKLLLKAGMFVTVTFRPRAEGTALVVPREALVGSVQDAKLYVVRENVARLRAVTVGSQIGAQIAIIDGLQAGEQVVVDGQNNLSDNAAVVVRDKGR